MVGILIKMDKLPQNINMLELTLSNICNSRCKMCDIGTEKFERREMSIEEIEKVLDSELAQRANVISLCGGEPFLRKDFVEIVKLIKKKLGRKFNLNVSTNGLDTKKIMDDVSNIINDVNLVLVFSLDGLEKTHNTQRGLDDAFERTMGTVDSIIKKFPKVEINLHLTITPINYREILDVYNLAKSKNLLLRMSFAHDVFYLTNFINKTNPFCNFNDEHINVIQKQLDKIVVDYMKDGNFGDALFLNQLTRRIKDSKYRFTRCFTSSNLILIKENGDVHICVMSPPIGNINEQSLDEIFLSERAEIIRKKAAEYKCPNCMMLCGSYFNYKKIGQLLSFFYKKNNFFLREGEKSIFDSYFLIRVGDEIPKECKNVFISFNGGLSKENGDKIKGFLDMLKKNNVDFEISKPLPPCLFSLKDRKIINSYNPPKSCIDCKEMFIIDEHGTIRFCDGLKKLGIEEDLEKQFSFLKGFNKEKKCYNDCNPFLRSKCLCLIAEKK